MKTNFGLTLAMLLLPWTLGAARGQSETATTDDKGPKTAQEHFDLAKKYDARAAEYRAEADTHRKMLADYKRRYGSPLLLSKTGRDPWVDKMKAHCEAYIKDAEALAAEATAFAEFHRMRGKEMQGQ